MSYCTKKISFTGLFIIVIGFQRAEAGEDMPSRFSFSYSVDSHEAPSRIVHCPGRKDIQRAVTRRLGYSPWHPDGAKQIRATISFTGNAIDAVVLIVDREGRILGERRLRSKERCVEVAEGIALTIAIAIAVSPPSSTNGGEVGAGIPSPSSRADEAGLGESPAETGGRPSDREPRSSAAAKTEKPGKEKSVSKVESARKDPAAEVQQKPRSLQLEMFIGGLGTWGSAPRVAPGMDAGFGVRWRVPSITLAVRYDFPSSENVAPGRVDVRQLVGEILPCLHYRFLMGCARVSVGALWGEGAGLEASQRVTLPSVWLGARVGVTVPVWSVLFIRIFADVAGGAVVNELRETGTEEILWQTSPVAVAWGLSVGAAFFNGKYKRNTISK